MGARALEVARERLCGDEGREETEEEGEGGVEIGFEVGVVERETEEVESVVVVLESAEPLRLGEECRQEFV